MCQQYDMQRSTCAGQNLSPCVRLFIELLLREDGVSRSDRYSPLPGHQRKTDSPVQSGEIAAANTYLR